MGNTHGAFHPDSAERENLKLEIMRRVEQFPVSLRGTIDRAKGEDTEYFLSLIEDTLIDLLYGVNGNGLDSDRDSNDEIETAIRFFPHVLYEKYWGLYPPIYAQLAYFKSAEFIPLLAKLAIELNQFETDERGGLFYRHWNVLRSLVNDDYRKWYDENDEEQQRLIDEKYVAVMKCLGSKGLLRKDDIPTEDLMLELSQNNYFPERRFRFLVDLDPRCFYDCQPSLYTVWLRQNDFRTFNTIFQLGSHHFPNQIGFIFQVENDGHTPFERACQKYGRERTTKAIGDFLVSTNDQGIEAKLDIMTDALVYAAASSQIHLDGLYFLFRRDPGRYCQAITNR